MKDLSNENVIHVKKDNVEYLQFRKLLEYSDVINHAYSLGIDVNFRSKKIGREMTPEEKKLSEDSYKNLCEKVGIEYKSLVKPNQYHTDNIQRVDFKIRENEPDFDVDQYKLTDGLMTDKKNITLGSTNADCILLFFFDPIKKAIANTHSGWKGTLQSISKKTVEKMIKEYNSDPKDIICCMCPSIRKCHFEVDKDVADDFYNEFKDLGRIDEIIEKNPNREKWNIDTVLINRLLLENLGLKSENIIDSGLCSVCNSDIMHSFRAEGENYGLETAIICLK